MALDHPQLAGQTISEHLRYFRQLFKHARNKNLLLFLDEIQESPNWQVELKALYDLEDVKLVCTGSTSSLIQSQGGKLTGRQIITTVYPLDFAEFLIFKGGPSGRAEEYLYTPLVEEYLQIGGYPENVLNPSEAYLNNLLDDILARDIVRLSDIRKAGLLKDLFKLTAASVGSRISYNKLAKTLGVALETVKDYIDLFESAFLVKTLGKWTTSHSQRVYANKKIFLAQLSYLQPPARCQT
ncbi:MAG: ATP-binding protein [Actinobacteria bacterium]|nr:ATP-binding protein [Actinomycetota bacterium]